MCFTVAGALCCFFWARRLYGAVSGLLALTLWCFAPEILGNAALITSDCAATATGCIACYRFSRWLDSGRWPHALAAGLCLAIALLAKFTWLLLLIIFPLLLVVHWAVKRSIAPASKARRAMQGVFISASALYLVNVCYLCEGSMRPLRTYSFRSAFLSGRDIQRIVVDGGEGGNRFNGALMGGLPIPLPEDYVLGIDEQQVDFDRGSWAYLNGISKRGGWYAYYMWALLLKAPLGLIALAAACIAIRIGRWLRVGRGPEWADVILLIPAVAIVVAASLERGINQSTRYVLPSLPFVLIWVSGQVVTQWRTGTSRVLKWAMASCVVWSIVSSLWMYPHNLAYFNELAGGPCDGRRYLLHGNIELGQDLTFLGDWLREHPELRPVHLAYGAGIYPECLGLSLIDITDRDGDTYDIAANVESGKTPAGVYAIGVNEMRDRRRDYRAYDRETVLGMAGYSIYIFDLKKHGAAEKSKM
jgi:Dolichyl-phosphate-mannose-protein mannosyltransferase